MGEVIAALSMLGLRWLMTGVAERRLSSGLIASVTRRRRRK
jgi:hypothetical protein